MVTVDDVVGGVVVVVVVVVEGVVVVDVVVEGVVVDVVVEGVVVVVEGGGGQPHWMPAQWGCANPRRTQLCVGLLSYDHQAILVLKTCLVDLVHSGSFVIFIFMY